MMRSLRASFGGVEVLESRRHFDAYVYQGTLVVDGTWMDDKITVGVDPNNSANVQTNINGAIASFPADQFTSVVITGYDGNDLIQIVQPNGQIIDPSISIEMYGNNGNDTLIGGDGPEYMDGQAGNDSIVGNGGNDTLHGSDGNDTILGGAGSDLIVGGAGSDQLRGGGGNDSLYGQQNADSLWGGAGSNFLNGGGGADTIYARNSRQDTVIGGAGFDQAQVDGTDVMVNNDVESLMA
jgi:Ca2+-binding RTX toxin-like protein